jgi:Tfp pilus assembly protein PilO
MQIEIKSRGGFIKNAAVVCLIILLFICSVWQIRVNVSLKQQLNAKRAEFKEAMSASKRLVKLQRQIQEIEEKERAINNQVPRAEQKPFGLVKALTAVAGEIGLRNIVFTINGTEKEKWAQPQQEAMTMLQQQEEPDESSFMAPESQALMSETPARLKNGAVGQAYAAAPAAGPIPLKLELGFKATYSQALNFLKRINGLERVVAVEGIRIERKKETLPFQKVSFELVTYAFPGRLPD